MASALAAYLNLMSTDLDDVAAARSAWETMAQLRQQRARGDARRGDRRLAGRRLDRRRRRSSTQLLLRWPTDVLALMIGHQLDFFLGDAQSLRDRPIRALRELPTDDPHADFVRGMAAFGLEEAGHYGQALDAGLAAVAANPDDVWAIHAVVHTYEMQGRVDEGIRFLGRRRRPDGRPATCSRCTTGGTWRCTSSRPAVPQQSLAIYDAEIHHADSPACRSRCSTAARCCGG